MAPSPSPGPLQSVLLYQHHQTTTPYAPGVGPATVTAAPVGGKEEKIDGEEH